MTRVLRLTLAASAAALAASLCLLVTPLPTHPTGAWLPAAGAVLLAVVVVAVATVRRAYRHHRLTTELAALARPVTLAGLRVHELPQAEGAFVAGLRRPVIFISPTVTVALTPDELRAVLRHERYHQIDQAPAKLVLLEGLAPLLSLLPAGRAWLARRLAELEIAADRYALAEGSSRRAIARALLKLGQTGQPSSVIGFASAAELRLNALMHGDEASGPPRSLSWLVGTMAAVAACLLLLP